MNRIFSKRLLVVFIAIAVVLAPSMALAVPGQATVKLDYLPGVDLEVLTVKVATGALSWSANDATLMAAASPEKNADGTYTVTSPGWFTLYSKGDGYYSIQTYFRVTPANVSAGDTVNVLVENNQKAGANNHEYNTASILRLPPISERTGAGNWTYDSKANTGNYIFALGSEVAPYTGPGYFKNPAFQPGRPYYQFTTQAEMEQFIAQMKLTCGYMYVYSAGKSPGYGHDIPVVIFTKENLSGLTMEQAGQVLQNNDKPTYFHGANIHGNEQSSGEGALAIMYDMAGAYGAQVIEDIDVIIYPRINTDGHQNHSRSTMAVTDLQPAVDMNRDHMCFKSMDAYYLHKAWNMFLPEISIDGHELGWVSYSINAGNNDLSICSSTGTTSASGGGSADDMQSTPATDLNVGADLTTLAISLSLQQQQDAIDSGVRMNHYTSTGTTKNNSIGRSYYGHMGSISILAETRGQTGGLLMRRTYTQYMTARSYIESARERAEEIVDTVAADRANIIAMGKTYSEDNRIVLLANNAGPDTRLGEIQRYNLYFDGTYSLAPKMQVDYAYTVNRDRSRPTGYVVPKDMPKIEDLLFIFDGQGIEYLELIPGAKLPLQQYYVSSPTTEPHNTAFRADLREKTEVTFPNGAYFIPMDQVAGTVIALTMEPDVTDSAGYGCSFVQGLINSSNNNILGGAAANVYLHDPETKNFPIYRFTENNPREAVKGMTPLFALSTDAYQVKKGDYFHVTPYFKEAVNSNAAILDFTFDKAKFEYRGFTPADGVTLLGAVNTDDGVQLTLMVADYNTTTYGELLFSAKDDADLKNEDNEISASVDYVARTETGKIILSEVASTIFTTTHGQPTEDGQVTLVTLSDIIDQFGLTSNDATWSVWRFFDFNNNGVIDIQDIAELATRVQR